MSDKHNIEQKEMDRLKDDKNMRDMKEAMRIGKYLPPDDPQNSNAYFSRGEFREMQDLLEDNLKQAEDEQEYNDRVDSGLFFGGKRRNTLGRKRSSKKSVRPSKLKNKVLRKRSRRHLRSKMKGGETGCLTNTRDICKCFNNFVKVVDVNNDNCPLCLNNLLTSLTNIKSDNIFEGTLDNKDHQIKATVVYQTGCGHQYHSYCLHEYLDSSEVRKQFKYAQDMNGKVECPVCRRKCVTSHDEQVLDAFVGDEIMGLNGGDRFLTEEYTGIPIPPSNIPIPPSNKLNDRFSRLFSRQTGGKRKSLIRKRKSPLRKGKNRKKTRSHRRR